MVTDVRQRLVVRALRWLAQREHSRSELRARLLRACEAVDEADTLVDGVLDQLQAQGWLSDARFIDSRVHQRQAGWGVRRIRHELRHHGLQLDAERQAALGASERARAQALWARRFGQPSETPAERARQMRFLAARGFSAEAIRHALGGAEEDLSALDADEA